eukprot:EW704508.1.p1 GENE.EW704508.1~~EW704508.1.p1  ORF type:complete len:167 (+),score=25.19 EW704508.1:72-503(+)
MRTFDEMCKQEAMARDERTRATLVDQKISTGATVKSVQSPGSKPQQTLQTAAPAAGGGVSATAKHTPVGVVVAPVDTATPPQHVMIRSQAEILAMAYAANAPKTFAIRCTYNGDKHVRSVGIAASGDMTLGAFIKEARETYAQ